ncbi:hypothetical protein IPA_01450 [Ignicoccus pacificus DSM 13166]|uniref:Uncharacterized protein n=1 Tax=Ignicoccus pacificus DSM 13166 TaxID=940294 RepID=A0A977PL34_9CREN|nr:hypothetical protein IPA_01450 [Ignicoccus pacificus DSM 13166]
MKLDFSKLKESLEKSFAKKEKKGRVPLYLRKCKYCKYIELMYCKYHTVTIHPESRACPAFVLQERFAQQVSKKEMRTA